VNDIKTSRSRAWEGGRHKKKTLEELEVADDKQELVITPLAGKKGNRTEVKKEKKKRAKRG